MPDNDFANSADAKMAKVTSISCSTCLTEEDTARGGSKKKSDVLVSEAAEGGKFKGDQRLGILERAVVLAQLGAARAAEGKRSAALEAYAEALRLRMSVGMLRTMDGLLLILETSTMHATCGDLAEARECYSLIKSLVGSTSDAAGPSITAKLELFELLDFCGPSGDSCDGGDLDGQAFRSIQLLTRLGAYKLALGDYDGALGAYTECCHICERMGSTGTLSDKLQDALICIGSGLTQQGNMDGAINAYSVAQQLRSRTQKNPETPRGATIAMNLGMAYHVLGDLRKALHAYTDARDACQHLNRLQTEDGAEICKNIGCAKRDLQDLAGALAAYSEAWAIRSSIGLETSETVDGVMLLTSIGELKSECGDFDGSLEAYNTANRISKRKGLLLMGAGVGTRTSLRYGTEAGGLLRDKGKTLVQRISEVEHMRENLGRACGSYMDALEGKPRRALLKMPCTEFSRKGRR